jgi:hypothetical protein
MTFSQLYTQLLLQWNEIVTWPHWYETHSIGDWPILSTLLLAAGLAPILFTVLFFWDKA